VFYDLGCGYALPCIWIADRVGAAVGIENFAPRYRRALVNVRKSGKSNVRIIKKSFQNVNLTDATIVHCVILLGLKEYKKIQSETPSNARLVLCYPPMFPIKAVRKGSYYLIKLPYRRVKSEQEYATIITGRKNSTIRDVKALFRSRVDSRSLKWQLSHSNYIWSKLRN
jgi:hypothetical protein